MGQSIRASFSHCDIQAGGNAIFDKYAWAFKVIQFPDAAVRKHMATGVRHKVISWLPAYTIRAYKVNPSTIYTAGVATDENGIRRKKTRYVAKNNISEQDGHI